MPQPQEPPRPQQPPDDSFLDLLAETLESLEEAVRGQFLKQFFRAMTQIDLSVEQSLDYWSQILRRRRELSDSLGQRISLKTAMVDVLASTSFLRVPILMEYEEFKKLQLNAATDALTGLYNRRLFEEYCEKELNRAKRYGQHLALVLLDLHRLKEVNDRHGHMQGDQVLQLAATTLRKNLRASDFAFRIGGDEFALLLPQADPEQASTLCQRLRAHYESEIRELKLEVPITLDFGVAIHPQDGDRMEGLLRLADERLYELKQGLRPRPRIVTREPGAEQRAATRLPAPVKPEPPVVAPPKAVPEPPTRPERRKWERVSLAGTRAYAVLGDGKQRTAAVIDLSYGGVALELENPEELPSPFYAVLHVPILPPVRVSLRRIYALREAAGRARVGCSFVS